MPFNIGPAELLVVMAIALIVFGPKKLPEIGRGIGSALREFNRARNDLMDSIHAEIDRPESEDRAHATDTPTAERPHPEGAVARSVEYPSAPNPDDADALPYGAEFQPSGGSAEVQTSGEPHHAPAPAGRP